MKLRMPYCLIVLLLLIVSCSNNDNANIDHAYRIVAEEPDSALTILNGVDRQQLSKSEEARYALVYTIAQDKSGLDVGNDSLIGLAFSYYDERPDDSLYAKCQYYMGKYYMLTSGQKRPSIALTSRLMAPKKIVINIHYASPWRNGRSYFRAQSRRKPFL